METKLLTSSTGEQRIAFYDSIPGQQVAVGLMDKDGAQGAIALPYKSPGAQVAFVQLEEDKAFYPLHEIVFSVDDAGSAVKDLSPAEKLVIAQSNPDNWIPFSEIVKQPDGSEEFVAGFRASLPGTGRSAFALIHF